jgi:3-oxoadipate enol-lactonase
MSSSIFCEVPAGRVAYTRQGSGHPIVLLHAIGIDRSWWDEYVRDWAKSYDVIAIDFRGHGASSLVTSPVTLSDHAADVAAVLRKEGVKAATIAGVSMGGMVAQRVAIEYPDLAGSLILCATAGAFPEEVRPKIRARGDTSRAGSMTEVADGTLERWFLPDSPAPALVERCRLQLLADDWYSWSANWEAISQLNNLAELANVPVPALVVAGALDVSIPPAVVQQIANALPKAQFVSVPGTSHFGAYEMRDALAPVFNRFLLDLAH